jgi:hypothetical protein
MACINRREEHHKRRSFRQKYLSLLRKFRVEYDDRGIFLNGRSERRPSGLSRVSQNIAPRWGAMDLLAALAINIRPLWGRRPGYPENGYPGLICPLPPGRAHVGLWGQSPFLWTRLGLK